MRRCRSAGPEDVAGEDPLAKPGREALHLRLHARHVRVTLSRPVHRVGTVRVCPCRVLARRRTRGVGDRLLPDQQERALGQAAGGHRRLEHLRRRPADVDGARLAGLRRAPGNLPVERPVDLERRRAVAVAAQRAHVARPAAPRPRGPRAPPASRRRSRTGAVSRSPPASSTPTTRPRSTANLVARRAGAHALRPAPAGRRPARRRAFRPRPRGWASPRRDRAGSDRRRRSRCPRAPAAHRSASPGRTATRAFRRRRTAPRRAPEPASAAAARSRASPRGPSPAASRIAARTGGKPPSIVRRRASNCRMSGSAKARQRSPSPAWTRSRLSAVRSTSRYSAAALPSGSGCA